MIPETILAVVRTLLDLILELVPHDVANQMLSDAAVKRQNAVADEAELLKFGET